MMTRSRRALLACSALALALTSAPSEAQPSDEALRSIQLEHLRERRRLGYGLLAWGALSLVGGGIVAIAGRDDTAWLSAGLTTASFGAINGALSIGLLDVGGRRRRAIDAREYASREQARMAQLKSGQVFALNLGLDVAYMAAGVLMFALGRRNRERGNLALRGAGLGMVSQGLGLFVFDLIAWRGTARRSAELAPAAF